jgi:tetratricopeptide (TPR) repeat protein
MTWPAPPSPRTLVIAGLVVLILALAVAGGWLWWDTQERRTMTAHAEVMARVQPALAAEAPTAAREAAARELEALLARYPSSRLVPQVAYELGNVRFASGHYPGARAAYDLALRSGATGLVRSLIQSARARTWEAERDFGNAAQAWGEVIKGLDPRSFLYEDALVDQARALELGGKKAEAIAAYQRVLKDVPSPKHADDIRSRLASLGTVTH